jgi:hypothetical protein
MRSTEARSVQHQISQSRVRAALLSNKQVDGGGFLHMGCSYIGFPEKRCGKEGVLGRQIS